MRLFCAVAVVALLAGPAWGQSEGQHVQKYGEAAKEKSPTEIEADRAAERAYKHSLGNIPDKGPVDPWGNVRSDSPPRDATKATPLKKTKTGSSTN